MNCSICNLIKSITRVFTIIIFLVLGLFSESVAQECVSDPSLLVKWDFTNAQQCNGLVTTKRKYWKPDVPLMTGGNQYCPQINDGCGQAMIYEKGFGNTNDFKGAMCVAGFWKNGGNKYFRAPGYDASSPDYDPDNESGNIWINYNFLPGQVGSLTTFQYNFLQNGYKAGGTVAFEKWGISVYRNGIRVFEETLPITAANVNNPANPLIATFPNTAEFKTDGSTEVLWEIAFALVQRNKSVRSGIDDLCIFGVKGQAAADVTAIPATCESGGVDGQLEIIGFSDGEKYDYNLGSTYTGTATYATATNIPADGIIANTLPLGTEAAEYSIRVFREDCYIDAVVVMPPVFCPYTCDFPTATITPNPATCANEVVQDDATIVLTNIMNMDRIGISAGQTYTGPAYAGATALGGATTYTFDNTDGITSGTCTEYYTIRGFNGAEDEELCIVDRVIAISPVSCDGCQVICAELVSTDSEETDPSNDLGQGNACMTDEKVDLQLTKTVDQNTGSNCEANGSGTNFEFTVTLENIGDLAAENVTIADVFPDEMVIVSITSTGGTPLESFGTIDWKFPTLAAGASETMTVIAAFVEAGTYQNCVEVLAVTPVNDPDNTNDMACATVTVTGVNLPSIEKAFSPAFARANVPIRLSLKIYNNESSPIALTQDLIDVLPSSPGQMVVAPNPNITSAIPGIVADAGASQLVVPMGTVLQPGLNPISIDVVAPANGDYLNVITAGDLVTTACSNPAEASAEVNIADENVIGPLLTKTFSNDMLSIGQTSTLTVTIENRNPENITLMADFFDVMPVGLEVTGTPTSSCGGASTFGETDRVGLASGTVISGNSACTIEVEVTATEAGFHCNRIPFNAVIVEVDLAGGGVMTSNEDIAEACLEVVDEPIFDLALRKTLADGQSSEVAVGSVVNYNITVFNQGTEEAIDVQVTDYVSTDLVFVDDATWEVSGDNVVLETPIASILPGASVTIPIQFMISPTFNGESITNYAEISSVANTTPDKDSTPDANPDNDKGGLVESGSDDVIFGDATMPGGAPFDENGLTDEDDSDPAIVHIVLACSMDVTATPGACINAEGNYYDLTGSITFAEPPASGSLTISIDGVVVETYTTFTSPQAFTISGLSSDGASHTIVTSFSDDTDCSAMMDYTAPAECFTPPTSNPCANGEMGGSVFVDSNGNGINDDGTSSIDLSGVKVLIFGCDEDGSSELIQSVFTDISGNYSFSDPVIVNGTKYRIEFDNIPVGFTVSVVGADNGTEVQYVDLVSCNVSLGIMDSEACIDPQVAVVCFTRNNDQDSEANIVFVDNDSGRAFVSNSSTDNGLDWGTPQGANAANYPFSHLEVSNKGEVNTTFGLDWDNKKRQLLSGAFMRAFAPMGTNAIGNNYAEATIYSISFDGNSPQTPTVWLDLETIYGDGFAGVYLPDNNFSTSNFGRTGNNPDKVGYTGLGSIRISKDHTEIYVVNLQSQEVLVIPMDNNGSAAADMNSIKRFPLPDTECGGTWPDGRPMKTVLGLGVHPQSGMVYASLTCTGPTVNDVTGYVYSFDPSDTTPSDTDFNLELTIPLNINRPATHANTSPKFWSQINHEWESVTSNSEFYNNDGTATNLQHNQPWLGEIEFTEDSAGSFGMTVVERNRYSDLINMSFYVAGGAMFKACGSEGSWSLELNGTCGSLVSGVNFSYTNANSAGSNTSENNRFYHYVGREGAMMSGTIGSIPGTGEIFSPATDNVFFRATSGISWLDPVTGERTRDTRIFGNFTVPATGITNFTKSNNWGGITAICAPAPIQIGNYAWIDTNGDGVQDPCEEPLSGLTVKLYTKPASGNAVLVESTTTSATGEYYFSDVEAGDYYIAFCGDSYDPNTRLLVAGGVSYVFTTADSGMGSNFDLNDSDVSGINVPGIGDLPAICISVDETDFTFDAGFMSKPVLELADTDIACGELADGGNLFASVEGGSAPFTYEWSESSYDGMENVFNVPTGTYSVTVTDASGCSVMATTEITQEVCTPNPCTGDNMGGTVFNDVDVDGTNDGPGTESGPEGILVQIFECDETGASVLIDETYTDENGDYFFSNPSIVDGNSYRIEFSGIPDGYQSSIEGTDNGTETQFVDMVSCDVDYGIMDPSLLCEDNPLMVTNCYVNGTMDGGVLVSWNYNDAGLISGGRPAPTYQANNNQIGTTWGLAYHKTSESAFTSAFLKRHSRLIDGDNDGSGDLGAIYNISMDGNPGNDNTPLWLDLDGAMDTNGNTINVGTIPNDAGRGIVGNGPNNDAEAFTKVGKVGIGDIDLNSAHDELWAVNVFDKTLLAITINSDMSPGAIRSFDIPENQCNGSGASNDSRPFAVKYFGGSVYVGVVCSGENTNDLNTMAAYVYRLDDDGTSTTFTEVLSFDLDYNRDSPDDNAGCNSFNNWLPWSDTWPSACCCGGRIVYPQPLLSDIEFNITTGEMLLGFIDRFGHQSGFDNYAPTGTTEFGSVSGGEVLKSTHDGDGTYTIETTIASGNEFYIDDFFDTGNGSGHDEIGLGGLAIIPGSTILVSTAYDPINGQGNQGVFISGGTIKFDNNTGQKINNQGYQIFNGNDAGTFGKAAGLGDLELLCDESIIQLGNYVWVDANGDGVQDPCEAPVSGLTVKLYTKPTSDDAELVATTMTDADGEYYFTNNTTAGETWAAGFTEVELGAEYYVVFCGDNAGDGSQFIESGGEAYVLTSQDSGMGDNPDFNDSDASIINVPGVGNSPAICVTADSINHTLDVGLKLECGITITHFSHPENGGAYEGILDVTWANGPTTGELEYRFDDTGAWTELPRTSHMASDSEQFTIPLPVGAKLVNIRFAEDTGCFIDMMFPFGLDDPAGYFYCERTGEILPGGLVAVTPPAGGEWMYVSDTNGDPIDGRDGFYEWVVVGSPVVPGTYTMETTAPEGNMLSMTRVPGTPAYGDGDTIIDPTKGGADNPMSLDSIFLGSFANADSTFLLDFTAAANPFFLEFSLHPEDAFLLNNNIPIKNCYCDLALVNKLDEEPTSIALGDTIKYDVIIENQGDVDATNIEVKYGIPNGFDYIALDGTTPSWTEDTDCATTMITDVIPGGESDTICIYLTVQNVPTDEVTEDSWTTVAEIASFEDPADPGEDKEDFDSTPDTDLTNDPGGNPDDDTDDETGGDGTGDPDDPNEDTDPDLDEDDHDPAIIYLCDAAAIVNTDDEGPFQYLDTVKYNVVVFNQGNGDITNVLVNDFLGAGLEFISTPSNTAEGWTGDSDQVTATFTETIGIGESDTLCLELQLVSVLPYDDEAYVQTVEIEVFEDPANPGDPKEDIDSTPDDDPENDSGGNPDDETDDETDGGGEDPNDPNDEDPEQDEDDNDSDILEVFDLAITKKIVDDRPYAPGETVMFEMKVYNQGNVDAASYALTDYLTDGFTFSTMGNTGWSVSGDNLLYTSSSGIAAGDSATVNLQLTVVIPAVVTGLSDWWNYVEISEADDDTETGNDPPVDADSTPDNDEENDNAVEPGDDDDNEVTENGNAGEDEDDHDPAAVIVGYDIALAKTVSPAGPYSYGDTLTYTITLTNQGGLTMSNIAVYDSLPCGLLFLAGENPGWTLNGSVATTTYTPQLASGQNATLELKAVVQRCEAPGYANYYNIAEVSDFDDEDGNEPTSEDIDSTPDDDPNNDEDPINDEILDPMDEDDHDYEDIAICDVALINTIAELETPPSVGDTVKYEVIVENQGNHDVNSVTIDYDIPNGFSYLPVNGTLTPVWSSGSDDDADITTDQVLAPGERDTVCLYLQLENVATDEVTEDSWTTIAEITEYTNQDDEVKTTDADSTPDDDPTNDPGGNPDDDTDDETEGDGTGDPEDPTEDMDPDLDEDDHDPAIVYICDVATIIYHDVPDDINYYDTLKFNVVVFNQGNGEITNVNLVDHLPEGLEYIETVSNVTEGWEESEEVDEAIELLYEEVIGVGESDTVCLELQIVPITDASDEERWLQVVEVESFEDPANPGDPKEDIDSTPDDDPDNDPGGNPDDETDDETDGEGTGDPEDEMEDMDPDQDEDDHDPVDVKVLDLALIMQIDSMPPVLPVVPGDVLKFIVVVTNQGNTPVNEIEITNYLMDNNLELADVPGNDDWTAVDSETNETVIPGESLPGDVDTICIYMEVLGGAMSDIVTYSEISGSVETDSGDCYDIDSTPDDSNENDEGGSPLTPEDDHIEDDGEDGNEDGITDEDDHDPAMLDVQDLALIVWADHKDPVQEGDDVKFTIRVINQGNVLNENIELVDYIPSGFALSVNDTNNWTADTLDDKKVYTTLAGSLAMGDTIETCIVLTVQEGVSAEDLINYAEIVSSTGPDGLDLNSLDVDSTPNDEPEDDTGGQYEDMPDCSTEPVVINDDNYVEGAGVIEEDEDDHDPAWVHVFDLASIIYTDQTLPVIPGDEVKFVVELYNQGNMSAEDIDLLVHIPDGFTLSANDDNDWEEEGENVVLTYEEAIIPEDSTSVCLLLEVLPDETLGGLIPVLEITGAMDTLGNDQSNNDIDSNPDENASDDEGGEIFTDSDDELEGNGEAGDDEDDHDPAVPPVLDLAITIVPENEEPKMPGDTAKFIITLKNQGSIVPSEFTIEEYIPEGLAFLADPVNMGWTPQGASNATYTYTEALEPLTEDTLCIYLIVTEEANPQNVVTMVEYIEVIDMEDRDVSLLDIDSEADNSNENDLGNDLYSVHNDKCDENGRSGGDEDDHDQAWVNMCGPMACKGSINFSLDESCEGSITAAMVLTGDIFPEHIYEITVKDSNGNPVPNEFGIGDVDQTYEVTVTNILCDNISCWLEVTVEYKFDPKIECVANDTLSCVQAFSEASEPTVSANCVSTELLLIDQEIESLDCDTMFTSRVERKYIARDVYGNTSDTCTQVIYLERTNLDSISPVQPFAIYNDKALDCGSGYATTSQGYPYPALSVTGAPRLRVEGGAFVDLYPFESNVICNGYAEFRDELLPGSNSCVTKIMRTFTIGEWWCGSTNERKYVQLIEVVDFTGPEITCPSDMTVSTATLECASMSSFTLPTASDLCNEDIRIDLSTPAGFIANYGGEQVELPVGVHELTYNAYDGCDNLTTCSFTVTVQDNADPIAICDQFTEVGISLDTVTYIYAESIDDGSFDECGEVTLGIARMDSPGFDDLTGFGPKVNVYCDDAGTTVMVGLLVTDAGGNTNMCMVSVDVKDKVDAKMVCPGSMTVECNFAYDEDNLSAFFGEVTIYDNCPSSNTIAEELVGELNSCGSGVLTRQIRLLDAQGDQVDYCEQTITFESGTPLLYSDITPPPSTVTVDGCGVESLDPNILGLPVVPSGICQQTGIAVENDTFPFAEEGACLKIIRTFSVIDWCIESGPGSIADPYKFTQIIKVDNTIAPTITNVFSDSTYCSYATDCGGTDITGLTASSSDDCTAIDDVDRRWEVYDAEDELVRSGLGHDASGYYDLGAYKVRFIAEDGCGNQTVRESSFTVMSCKQPVAYCLDGLSTTLTAMDTDGDGTADAEQVMLTPSYFDAGSYHPCGLDVVLSFSSDLDDTLATFFCSDTTGVVEVELWVTAVDEEGNPLPEMQSYCVAALDVQNNEDIDLCNGLRPSVQGRIYTSADAEVEEVKVELRSSELLIAMTDEAGAYGFMEMPMGGSYELAPGKDDDVLNGVTTLDLVMIQRHLLGIETFDAVDKYIAADINRDDRLTASDLLALRKVILGIETNFPNNTSWRFIDESHEYEDESNPWTETLPETYDIGSLSEDMWIDFVGIKVGDINGNVEANIAAGLSPETRSSEEVSMSLPDVSVESGEVYELEVLATESIHLKGMQYEMDVDGLEVIDMKQGVMNMKMRDVSMRDGALKVSYANGIGDYVSKDEVLFTMVVKAKRSGQLSEMLRMLDRTIKAESYLGEGLEVGGVSIEWRDAEEDVTIALLEGGMSSPNPWRNETTINFELPRSGKVVLTIRDSRGSLVIQKEQEFASGAQSFIVTEEEVRVTGLLLYDLQYEDQVVHQKMIRIQ